LELSPQGDSKKKGLDEELPEQILGNFVATSMPDIYGPNLLQEGDYFRKHEKLEQ